MKLYILLIIIADRTFLKFQASFLILIVILLILLLALPVTLFSASIIPDIAVIHLIAIQAFSKINRETLQIHGNFTNKTYWWICVFPSYIAEIFLYNSGILTFLSYIHYSLAWIRASLSYIHCSIGYNSWIMAFLWYIHFSFGYN